ncbi:MAG: 23S rRNA (adenine(2503)-C(2))-methyltransferase RlmN [Ilumatobacteraceae bacterium]
MTSRLPRYEANKETLAAILQGLPRYRVEQVWKSLYSDCGPTETWTTLPRELRTELDASLPCSLREIHASTADDGLTTKFLYEVEGGARIESVLMLYSDRATVCISSQAGCAMGCTFCATGQQGFSRHLTSAELIEQVARAKYAAAQQGRRLSNVVVMGMGEPLANEDALWPAMQTVHDAFELSARHITVSTVGLVPGIRRLADRPLPVTLAVSLHAATDELRNTLIPMNKRYPIDDLMAACAEYVAQRRRRMSFEWAMIEGVNDDLDQAERLAELCRQIRPIAHVNLIPLNRTSGYAFNGSTRQQIEKFQNVLLRRGVEATVRRNRGNDIDAACGQLAAITPVSISPQSTKQ